MRVWHLRRGFITAREAVQRWLSSAIQVSLSCWGWYFSEGERRFDFGAHDYGGPATALQESVAVEAAPATLQRVESRCLHDRGAGRREMQDALSFWLPCLYSNMFSSVCSDLLHLLKKPNVFDLLTA